MATAEEMTRQNCLFEVEGSVDIAHHHTRRKSAPEKSATAGVWSDRQLRLSGIGYFDAHFPLDEQLPRQFVINFNPVRKDRKPAIQLLYQEHQVGDILTDNSHIDDGYRFHDVFHFAHAAILRWSPMVRKLFGCKRKSDSRVDEVEDGARARILEEAACAIVFEYARKRNFLDGATEVSSDVLDSLCAIMRNYEVGTRTPSDWESAILQGYRVWREMRKYGGGILAADLEDRRIEFLRPEAAERT